MENHFKEVFKWVSITEAMESKGDVFKLEKIQDHL